MFEPSFLIVGAAVGDKGQQACQIDSDDEKEKG